ncbi:MAG: hypothetical protein FJ091_08760 [Deltaproteobacteria bacterium]|nr:hypothetical protein [Deltaproteobacteria bacterium]
MSLELFAPPLALSVGALGATRLLSRACGLRAGSLPFGAQWLTGLALLCAVAGWFVALGAYSRAAAYALCALAALGFVLPRAPRESRPGARESATWASALWLLPIAAFVLARGLGALRFPHYNPCDDFVQYLHFPRLLLETGAFEEPFSTRRLGVLGSGQWLQSFFAPGFGVSANAAADAFFGLPALLGAALLACDAASRGGASVHAKRAFVLLALLGTLSVPYINTLPLLLPYASALALFALHARMAEREADATRTRDAVAFGVIAAFAIGLRVSNAVLPAALWAFALSRAALQRDRGRLRLAAIAALTTALALAPWSLSLWRSSGTPLFPLFAGNYRFDDLFAEPMAPARLAAFALECALAARVPVLLAVAALACAPVARRALALELAAATLLLGAATTLVTSAFDSWTVLR